MIVSKVKVSSKVDDNLSISVINIGELTYDSKTKTFRGFFDEKDMLYIVVDVIGRTKTVRFNYVSPDYTSKLYEYKFVSECSEYTIFFKLIM